VAAASDSLGNRVGGVAVTWAATGGALTAATTTTGASGDAEVVFTSDPAPRSYAVSATATGLGTVVFTVVGQ
jgi:hypothetical protein